MVIYEDWKDMDREIRRIVRRDKVRSYSKWSKDKFGYPVKTFTLTTKEGITYEYTIKNRLVEHPWFDMKIPDGYVFSREQVELTK